MAEAGEFQVIVQRTGWTIPGEAQFFGLAVLMHPGATAIFGALAYAGGRIPGSIVCTSLPNSLRAGTTHQVPGDAFYFFTVTAIN